MSEKGLSKMLLGQFTEETNSIPTYTDSLRIYLPLKYVNWLESKVEQANNSELKCSCGDKATHHYCAECYQYIQGVLNICG